MLFQSPGELHVKISVIRTTNEHFAERVNSSGDAMLTKAMLDRLLAQVSVQINSKKPKHNQVTSRLCAKD